jgi:hypothetical protein
LLRKLWQKRIYRPVALIRIVRDMLDLRGPVRENRIHLREAVDWILRAQAATPDDGVSMGYSFEDGWIHSYPETTGYIIPSLLSYAAYEEDATLPNHALAMAEWELSVQLPAGAFPGDHTHGKNQPSVFNTGQILFGLLAAFRHTGEKKYLSSARKAGEWLVNVQAGDGSWQKFDYRNTVHSYNTRTAWALIELAGEADSTPMKDAGIRNLEWVMGRQCANAWFQDAAFSPEEHPFLHTIAYTIQGLLESGLTLNRQRMIESALRAGRILLDRIRPDGSMAGCFDSRWSPKGGYSCLTGIAQMAGIWYRAFSITGEERFRQAALRANRYLKSLQHCSTRDLRIRGAIKGSHPIWGGYLFGTYPNWAAKFFIDALLLEEAALTGKKIPIPCG